MSLLDHKSQLKHLGIGVIIAFAITSIVLLAYSMLLTYTDISETTLPTVIAITTFISVLVAGFDAAKGAPQRGWLWGMCAGGVYVVTLATIMAILLPGFAIDGRTLLTVAIGIGGGGLGGMLGINLRR